MTCEVVESADGEGGGVVAMLAGVSRRVEDAAEGARDGAREDARDGARDRAHDGAALETLLCVCAACPPVAEACGTSEDAEGLGATCRRALRDVSWGASSGTSAAFPWESRRESESLYCSVYH